MTTTHHPKTIVAAIVAGALALAVPAGASVLNPVTDSWGQGATEVQTVNSTYQPSGQNGSGYPLTSATARAAASDDGAVTASAVPLHPWSNAAPVASTQTSTGGDGFDFGSAAVGAGVVLLLACLAMIGSSAIGGRRSSQPKPGAAVQAA